MPVPTMTSEECHWDFGELSETIQTINLLSGPPTKSMSYQFREEELMWDKVNRILFSACTITCTISEGSLHV